MSKRTATAVLYENKKMPTNLNKELQHLVIFLISFFFCHETQSEEHTAHACNLGCVRCERTACFHLHLFPLVISHPALCVLLQVKQL